jgi:hypothetical protein
MMQPGIANCNRAARCMLDYIFAHAHASAPANTPTYAQNHTHSHTRTEISKTLFSTVTVVS